MARAEGLRRIRRVAIGKKGLNKTHVFDRHRIGQQAPLGIHNRHAPRYKHARSAGDADEREVLVAVDSFDMEKNEVLASYAAAHAARIPPKDAGITMSELVLATMLSRLWHVLVDRDGDGAVQECAYARARLHV